MTELDRQLPANLDAERAVLGSILINEAAYDRVAGTVSPSDFFNPDHREIYGVIVEMGGREIDTLTLKERLRGRGREIPASQVSALTDGIPDVARIEKYAEIVRDMAIRRQIIIESERLSRSAFDGDDIRDTAVAASAWFAQHATAPGSGPTTLRKIAKEAEARLEHRMLAGSWCTGIATDLPTLDGYTLGLQRGVLSVFGARPAVGKTAISISPVVISALRKDYRVVYVELDMSPQMFGDRFLAAVSGVSLFKIRSGQGLSAADTAALARAQSEIHAYGDRLILNCSQRSIDKIVATVRREARNAHVDLVIIDHVGHVRGGRGEKRYLEIGDVSARLIELANETNASVIALAQLNREAEGRAPAMSDLRESGNLEQDARLIVLLDRPYLRDETIPQCRLDLILAKNEGEAGRTINAHFDLTAQRITEEANGACRFCR